MNKKLHYSTQHLEIYLLLTDQYISLNIKRENKSIFNLFVSKKDVIFFVGVIVILLSPCIVKYLLNG